MKYIVVRRYSGPASKKHLLKVGTREIADVEIANTWADFLTETEPHANKWYVLATIEEEQSGIGVKG